MSFTIRESRPAASLTVTAALLLAAPLAAQAQSGGSAAAPRESSAFDMTGYWVSVVTEDWQYRMVAPDPGVYGGIPLNAEGRRVADGWDPARDAANGEECRAYGAAAIMRVPGRLHIEWQDDETLRIETDAGSQTRLFHFDETPARSGDPTWQGHSTAVWRHARWEDDAAVGDLGESAGGETAGGASAGAGSLEVVTSGLRPGYLRKNGVPYSEDAVVTEYYNQIGAPNGDQWLVVTTIVEDPVYLSRPYVTSANFKKLPDSAGWNPTSCSAT